MEPESLTVTDGEPLGWLDAVIVFSESNTVEVVSWFRRFIVNEPKPMLQAATVEVVVNEAGLVVLGDVSPMFISGAWPLMSSWTVPSSEVALVQKKSELLQKVLLSLGFSNCQSVISIFPVAKFENMVVESE